MAALQEWLDAKLKTLKYSNPDQCAPDIFTWIRTKPGNFKLKTDYAPADWTGKLCLVLYSADEEYLVPYDYPQSQFIKKQPPSSSASPSTGPKSPIKPPINDSKADSNFLTSKPNLQTPAIDLLSLDVKPPPSKERQLITAQLENKINEMTKLKSSEYDRISQQHETNISRLSNLSTMLDSKINEYQSKTSQIQSSILSLTNCLESANRNLTKVELLDKPSLEDLVSYQLTKTESDEVSSQTISQLFVLLDKALDSGMELSVYEKLIRKYARTQFRFKQDKPSIPLKM